MPRYTFKHPWESTAAVARMNEQWFEYATAAELWREAADLAPADLKAEFIERAERAAALAGPAGGGEG